MLLSFFSHKFRLNWSLIETSFRISLLGSAILLLSPWQAVSQILIAEGKEMKEECESSGLTWEGDSCYSFPSGMLGQWYYVGSHYEGADVWDWDHAGYDTAHQESTLAVELMFENRNIFFASVDEPDKRGQFNLLDGQDQNSLNGAGLLASFEGEQALAIYVPANLALTHPVLENLRSQQHVFEPDDWLVFYGDNMGYHYFNQGHSKTYPVGEFRRQENNACFQLFNDRRKLNDCVEDPKQSRYNYIDQATPLETAVRMTFQKRTGKSYTQCLSVGSKCAFERELSETIRLVTSTLPFLQTKDSLSALYQMLDDRAKEKLAFAKTEADIRLQASKTRDEIEAILDAFSYTGNEVLASGINKQESQQKRLFALLESIAINASCTGGGFLPTIGTLVSVACSGASIADAIREYMDEEFSDLPEVARTPTAINAKRFFQAVIQEDKEDRLRKLSNLRELSIKDTQLAHMIATNGLDSIFLRSKDKEEELKRNMWMATIQTLGFLVGGGENALVFEGKEPLVRLGGDNCIFISPEKPMIATEPFRILQEGDYSDSASSFRDVDWKPNFDSAFARYKYTLVNWEIMVGRPVERRPLNKKKFEELIQLIPPKELFEQFKNRRYLITSTQVTFDKNVPSSNALTTTKHSLEVVVSDNSGIFLLPDEPTKATSILHGAALNPSNDVVTMATGEWGFPDDYCFYKPRDLNKGSSN